MLIGRETEINHLTNDLKHDKSIRLVTGESGIGKSALLDEFYHILTNNERNKNSFLTGYYDYTRALLAEPQSGIYPLTVALSSLLVQAEKSQELDERIEGAINRIQNAMIAFTNDYGSEVVLSIVEDLMSKVLGRSTFGVLKRFVESYRKTKPSLMLARDYIDKHSEEASILFLKILDIIGKEFKDRQIVLIFDQFEYVGKAAIDIFLNFVKFMPERFHILVSFTTDDKILYDSSLKKLYKETKDQLLNKLGGKEIQLEGLSIEDIGRWIKVARGIHLESTPDLRRIKENSAGFPLLLKEWIYQPIPTKEWITQAKSSNYEEIGGKEKLRDHIIKRRDSLRDEDIVNINKLSVFAYPLENLKDLAEFLGMTGAQFDHLPLFLQRLVENCIFEKNEIYHWFKHELVRRYIRDSLPEQFITLYHRKAAEFYLSLEKATLATDIPLSTKLGAAYHLHEGGDYQESYKRNESLAEFASSKGLLDLAERCYNRAIDDAKEMGQIADLMRCTLEKTSNVYYVWGRYEEAIEKYEDVLKYYSNIGDQSNTARVLHQLAMIYSHRDNHEKAIDLYMKSLSISRNIGDLRSISMSLQDIAIVYSNEGKYDEARNLYEESLSISNKLDDKRSKAQVLRRLALIHQAECKYDEAIRLCEESLSISREIGDRYGIARVLHQLARIYQTKGLYSKALNCCNESLSIKKELGDQKGIGITLLLAGTIFIHQKMYDKALPCALQAYEILNQRNHYDSKIALSHLNLLRNALGESQFKSIVSRMKDNIILEEQR